MARLRARVERAAALHRQAAATAAVAGPALDGYSPVSAPAEQYAEQHDLAARMRAAAAELAPGWLGAPLDALAATTPLGGVGAPTFVRVGQGHPLDDVRFPIVVPLLGAGHLAIDADARDPRVAGLLRSLVLRLLAAAPVGSLQIRTVDTAAAGTTFSMFHGIDGVMPPPATDRVGLRSVLAEAEQWVRQPPGDDRVLLIMIASLPELTEGSDLARIAALAQTGPVARLHLVVAGWPPPPLTAETTQAPLPRCTQVTVRNPYAWVGDPPGATFTSAAAPGTSTPAPVSGPGPAGFGPPRVPGATSGQWPMYHPAQPGGRGYPPVSGGPATGALPRHAAPEARTGTVPIAPPPSSVPPGPPLGPPTQGLRPAQGPPALGTPAQGPRTQGLPTQGPPTQGPPTQMLPGQPHSPATRPGSRLAGRLNAPAYLDPDPPAELVHRVCGQLAAHLAERARLAVTDLVRVPLWQELAVDGLSTVVGRVGDSPYRLRFDDATPHWMVGGRSGSGKTAFLLDVLYGLSTRYGPDELALYLLDFKEGVSFSEFAPSPRDPSWLPHARAVGIGSDREYGLAVLRELDAEMTRRSVAYKETGVTRFADLRRATAGTRGLDADPRTGNPGTRTPRIVCVIDEFQVLLTGNDPLAREATTLLESLARTGRSYGIHLVLSSQTVRGVEALYGKRDSIFGQFTVRIALPGGGDVLDPLRPGDEAGGLPLGGVIVNTAAGTAGFDQVVRFPDPYADQAALTELRHRLWSARPPGNDPPSVFAGHAPAVLADDPTYQAFASRSADPDATPLPADRPARVLLGRFIDVPGSTASFPLDASPGRHVAIVGPDPTGAGILAAATLSVAAQHRPGTVRFLFTPADGAADTRAALHDAGHLVGDFTSTVDSPAYVVAFGADGLDVRGLLRDGPPRGVHLLGWWRVLRRFTDDIGGSLAREDVACLLFTNVPAGDVSLLIGQPVDWQPRPYRALLHDRHAGRTTVIVPFIHSGQQR